MIKSVIGRFSLHNLRLLLILLVLLALVPGLGLALFSGMEELRRAEKDAYEDAQRAAGLLALVHEDISRRAHQLLETLALLPTVVAGDFAASQNLFSQLLSHNPDYTNIILLDQESRPRAWVVPLAENNGLPAPWAMNLLQTTNFALFFVEPATPQGSPKIIFSHPVLGATGLVGHVCLEFDLEAAARAFMRANLPDKASFAICDQEGRFLFRHPRLDLAWDKSLPAEQTEVLQGLTAGRDDGVSRGVGLDQVPRLYALKRLRLGSQADRLFVRVGFPEETALSESRFIFMRNVSALGLIAVLTLLAARLFGDRLILRSKDTFLRTARRIRQGDLSARTGLDYTWGEFGELAETFDTMVDAMLARENEQKKFTETLRQSEERIRALFNATTDSVMLLDTQGRVMAANEPCAIRRNTTPQAIQGLRLHDLLPLDLARTACATSATWWIRKPPISWTRSAMAACTGCASSPSRAPRARWCNWPVFLGTLPNAARPSGTCARPS